MNAADYPEYTYLALTPPMGWNSWNIFAKDIDEVNIKAAANAMVASGMRDAGYQYLVLDDAWMASERDVNGALQADPVKFPKGMKDIGDYIHSKGLKFGIYEDRAYRTCQSLPGSFEHLGLWQRRMGVGRKGDFSVMAHRVGYPILDGFCL